MPIRYDEIGDNAPYSDGQTTSFIKMRGNVGGGQYANNRLYVTPQPAVFPTSNNAGVLAGASVSLIAAQAGKFYVVKFLTVEISVTGRVQFLDGTDVVLDLNLTANVPFTVAIPDCGLSGQAVNTEFSVKNPQSGALNIIVNYAFVYTGMNI
jgi:hypothetical protein